MIGIQNPSFTDKKSGIQYLESGIHSMVSRIQEFSIPLHAGKHNKCRGREKKPNAIRFNLLSFAHLRQ